VPVPAPAPAPRPAGRDPAAALGAVRAALHDLANLLQRVIGPADLLAQRPGVTGDPAAAAELRALVAACEAALARVADLRRATGGTRGGPAPAAPPGGSAPPPPRPDARG
jgi:hypothetical protein